MLPTTSVPERTAVSVELGTGGMTPKLEPMFGSSLKGRVQQRLPLRLRGHSESAGLFDPFTNGTEGPGAPPYSWLEIVKTVLMTPIAITRILLFTREAASACQLQVCAVCAPRREWCADPRPARS